MECNGVVSNANGVFLRELRASIFSYQAIFRTPYSVQENLFDSPKCYSFTVSPGNTYMYLAAGQFHYLGRNR